MSKTPASWPTRYRVSVSSKAVPPVICVIDASALIHLKREVGLDEQWELLMRMHGLVVDGALAFPRQVHKELSVAKYPDAPGAWAGAANKVVWHPQPSDDTMSRVLEVASQLVEVNLTPDREVADPYVAAMALELTERHPSSRVVVVTDDVVDRMPLKISLRTGCERLSLQQCGLGPFVEWVRDQTDDALQDPPEDEVEEEAAEG
jgi:rRNA maturation endonuclease Nob1